MNKARNTERDNYIRGLIYERVPYKQIQEAVKAKYGTSITKGRISQIKTADMATNSSGEPSPDSTKDGNEGKDVGHRKATRPAQPVVYAKGMSHNDV